jgi:SAM-dependent methyltransferase
MVLDGDGPFGITGAERYDIDAQYMPSRYKHAHRIQNNLLLHTLQYEKSGNPVVVDLGCGTGTDGHILLSATDTTKYVGIDCSDSMLSRAYSKLHQFIVGNRAILAHRDILQVSVKEVMDYLSPYCIDNVFCVISAFVLHHYTATEKHAIFRFIYALLPKNGYFILTDLFASEIRYCNDVALNQELSDIRRIQQLNPRSIASCSCDTTVSEHHYLVENRPHVLSDDIRLLHECGFLFVDVAYRSYQVGVIMARR